MNGKTAVNIVGPGGAAAWLIYQAATTWFPVIPSAASEGEMLTTLAALAMLLGLVFRGLGIVTEKANGPSK